MEQAQEQTGENHLNCHVCGHFGTQRCAFDSAADASCDSFLSWSDLWHREMAAIQRAQRATYVIAGLIGTLAIVILVLPAVLA